MAKSRAAVEVRIAGEVVGGRRQGLADDPQGLIIAPEGPALHLKVPHAPQVRLQLRKRCDSRIVT